jgi:hypothetical protein
MPKIQWTNLPPALRQHLFDRLEERKITAEDLYQLKLWRESEPDAPEGEWYKDFGSFKICGEGKFPKTFLLKGQAARGKALTSSRKHNPRDKRPEPGQLVVLTKLPPRFLDDLPKEDQQAISHIVGKPIRLNEYDEDGRAELEFTDSNGVIHSIWVDPDFIRSLT